MKFQKRYVVSVILRSGARIEIDCSAYEFKFGGDKNEYHSYSFKGQTKGFGYNLTDMAGYEVVKEYNKFMWA